MNPYIHFVFAFVLWTGAVNLCYAQIPNGQSKNALQTADSLLDASRFQEALDIYEANYAGLVQAQDWAGALRCLNQQGLCLDYLNTPKRRVTVLSNAFSLADSVGFSAAHGVMGSLYKQMGEVKIAEGKYDSANSYFDQAIPALANGEIWDNYVYAIALKGIVAYYQTDYLLMRTYLEKAQQAASSHTMPEKDAEEASNFVLRLLGVCYFNLGDYDASLGLYQTTLEKYLSKPVLTAKDSVKISKNYQNAGLVYYDKGDYLLAESYFENGYRYHYFKGNTFLNRDQAHYYHNRGLVHLKRLAYSEAAQSFEQAIQYAQQAAKPLNNTIATSLGGLSLIARERGNCQGALAHAQAALPYATALTEEVVQSNLGQAYACLGKQPAALEALGQALSLTQAKLGRQHPETARRLMKTGQAFALWGQYPTAMAYYDSALWALNDSTNTGYTRYGEALEIWRYRAEAYMTQWVTHQQSPLETLHNAFIAHDSAIAIINDMRRSYQAEGSKLLLQQHAKPIFEGAINAAVHYFEQTADSAALEKAFSYSEQAHAMVLAEALGRHHAFTLGNLPDTLAQMEKNVQTGLQFYQRQLLTALAKNNLEKVRNHRHQLFALRRRHDSLASYIQKAYPAYHDFHYGPRHAAAQDIAARLAPGEWLIEFFWGQESIYLFKVAHGQGLAVHKVPRTSALDSIARALGPRSMGIQQALASGPAAFKAFHKPAYTLYKALLRPLLGADPTLAARKLHVVPDGPLHEVPFELLITRPPADVATPDYRSLDYLVNNLPINYQYAGYFMHIPHIQAKSQAKVLALAPHLSGARALPASRQELNAIAQYYPGTYLLGAQAALPGFVEQAGHYDIIHLATHGQADLQHPLASFIELGTPKADSTAKLYAFELSGLSLPAAMVVLSSCEGGRGKHYQGEGVASFARAISHAGAGSVAMNLWKVDDQVTAKIVALFYTYLAKGLPRDEALQKAKADYIAQADPASGHPAFWAALVHFGDTAPLKPAQATSYLWGVLLLVLSIIGGYWLYKKTRQRRQINTAMAWHKAQTEKVKKAMNSKN